MIVVPRGGWLICERMESRWRRLPIRNCRSAGLEARGWAGAAAPGLSYLT